MPGTIFDEPMRYEIDGRRVRMVEGPIVFDWRRVPWWWLGSVESWAKHELQAINDGKRFVFFGG